MGSLWHDYLFTPLFNILIFIYNEFSFGNMGVAIIELTVILRVILLPLSVLDERNRFRYEKLDRSVETIKHDFKDDPVKIKEKIRELLRQNKVSYWSKIALLGVQFLVLVLLYQVFVGGIRFNHHESLYYWVQQPAKINLDFLGFNVGHHSVFWAALVAGFLFVNIYTVQKQHEHLVTKSDLMYLFLFPLFTFTALVILPMVKSIFILTSMLFTMIVFGLRKVLFKVDGDEKDEFA